MNIVTIEAKQKGTGRTFYLRFAVDSMFGEMEKIEDEYDLSEMEIVSAHTANAEIFGWWVFDVDGWIDDVEKLARKERKTREMKTIRDAECKRLIDEAINMNGLMGVRTIALVDGVLMTNYVPFRQYFKTHTWTKEMPEYVISIFMEDA